MPGTVNLAKALWLEKSYALGESLMLFYLMDTVLSCLLNMHPFIRVFLLSIIIRKFILCVCVCVCVRMCAC